MVVDYSTKHDGSGGQVFLCRPDLLAENDQVLESSLLYDTNRRKRRHISKAAGSTLAYDRNRHTMVYIVDTPQRIH